MLPVVRCWTPLPRWRQDLSPRWGQAAPAGGALLPGWTSCAAPTRSLRSAPDFLVRDHGRFLLRHVRGSTRDDVIWEEPSNWNQGEPSCWVSSLRFGSVRPGELVELLNRVCQWDGGVPMTVAHYREHFVVKWIMALEVWGLYSLLVFKCSCCFTFTNDGTLCFMIVNFVVICIHRGLPSQTHHCWASTGEEGYFRYQSTN